MPYIQKATPPPNKIETFALRNFVGGLNNRSEILGINEASDILNMSFADDTVMTKRFGVEQYGTFTTPGAVTHLEIFRPYKDPDVIMRGTDSKLYAGEKEIKTVAGRVSGATFNGMYFFVDGDKLYVYGKFAQTTSTYEVLIGAAVNDYVVMEVKSAPASYTALDTSHTRGVTRVDYTNRAIWYEPCELEKKDTFMGVNVVPAKPRFIVVHGGRLFVSGVPDDNDNVFISHIQNPYYFPVTLPVQLPPNSDLVRGLAVYDDSVVIGRRDDMYSITGKTNRTDVESELFRLRKINTHAGFANSRAVDVVHNYLFYLGSDGNVYALNSTRQDDKIMSTSIISRKLDLFKPPINATYSLINDCSSFFHEDNYYLTLGELTLVYGYKHQAWTVHKGLRATCFARLDNQFFWGCPDGKTAKFSKEYLDFGIPFKAFWSSSRFDMGDSSSYKQFREFFIVAHTFEKFNSDIYITFEVDYVDVNADISLSNQLSIFGKSRWGDRFITRNINASLPFQIGRRGRTIKFTFASGHYPSAPVNKIDDLQFYLNRKQNTLAFCNEDQSYYLFDDGAFRKVSMVDLNQPMKVYEMNGDYEFRGKR